MVDLLSSAAVLAAAPSLRPDPNVGSPPAFLPCGCLGSHASTEVCDDCGGRGCYVETEHGVPRACEECDGRGHMLCSYCDEPATAGLHAVAREVVTGTELRVAYRHEHRCEDCHSEIARADERDRRAEAWASYGDYMRDQQRGEAA